MLTSRWIRPCQGAVIAFLSGCVVAGPAFAQELEEITVTARKRAEGLQDVSVSIQVVSGEQLLEKGTVDMNDLSQTLPAVTVVKGGASDQLYIRGIGSGFNGGFEQAVGTYIDGVYLGRSRGSRAMMFDLDRVELLKGPQTTFFGNSSIAGAFNITTATPTVGEKFNGHISAMGDFNHGEKNLEAALNIPLGDRFAVRLAARKYDMDGYIDNTWFGGQEGGHDDKFGRITAVWEPTESFKAVLKHSFGDMEQTAPFAKEVIQCNAPPPANPNGRPGSSCAVHAGLFDNQLNYAVQHSRFEMSWADFSNTSLQLDWDAGGATVTSVTGWIKNENRDLMDLDSGPYTNFNTNQYDEIDQFSQELRLTSNTEGKLDWMFGFYFQDGDVTLDGNNNPYFVAAPPWQAAITATQAAGREAGTMSLRKQNEKTKSAFTAMTLHVNDANRLLFGLRWIEIEKSMSQLASWATFSDVTLTRESRQLIPPPFGGFITAGSSNSSASWDDLLPSVIYEHDFSTDNMAYLSFSQGFKGGGFDFSNRDGNVNPIFDEETVNAYELGFKTRAFNNRLILNGAVFFSDYKGVQQSVLNPANFTFSVSNAAGSSTRGVELDTTFSATDNLTLFANLTFMDAQFDEFLGACNQVQIDAGQCATGFQDLAGKETTFAPNFSGSIRAEWAFDAGSLLVRFSPSAFITDSYYLQSDLDPFNRQDGYIRWDARLAVGDHDGRWEVALIGKNLSDEKVMFFANDLPGSPGSYMIGLERSRSVGLQARFNF
ncbi:MAG: TonB-dependent receptor [Steroidobacteraceae bacterium]